jgi:hypothetical protein
VADERVCLLILAPVCARLNLCSWSSDRKLHELGRWNQYRLHDGVEGFMLRLLTSTLQWPYDQAQDFLAGMRANLRDYRTHAYLPVTVCYAQKPLDAPSVTD